ncbi:hypothetical protein BDV93DRAFT_472983 [Ceratobasidium sp. AG-I]|nr:hypothetical protein BDV93DRAFT_472983 [Ceratobasidium sp. AG-I]
MSMATRTTFPSAPQLPQKPTPLAYEQACRLILRQRFKGVRNAALVIVALATPISTLNFSSGLVSFIFKNLIHIALVTAFGVFPTLVARKLRRQAPSTPRPKTLIAEIASISPLYVGIHAASGAMVASLYAFFLGSYVPGIKFSLFTGSNRHPYSLNERHLMLVIGNVLLAIIYSIQDSIVNRDPKWLRKFGGLAQRRSAATWKAATKSSRFALVYWAAFLMFYVLLRVPFWGIVNRLFGFVIGPFLHFIVRPRAVWQIISFTLFWRMLVLQFSTLVMWDVAGAYFEINASHYILLSQFKEDANASLIAGLQSKDDYYKYFAFAELANVVATRPPRRVALFSDLKANPTPWEQVCRECLLLLGKDYSALVNRNAPLPSAPAPTPAPTINPKPTQPQAKDALYKPSASTTGPLDAFVGAANTVANVVPTNLNVPSIFLSTSAVPSNLVPVADVQATLQKWKLPDLTGLSKAIVDMLPPNVAGQLRLGWNVLFAERQEAVLEGLLQGRDADVWAIQALSMLVTHSLQEDPYGRVQRDIPRVLEAMIAYLGALEQLVDEVNALPVTTLGAEDAIKNVAQPVAEALRDGIRMIVLEFGPRLTAFSFPPRIAKRLQTMVDYL